MPKVLIVYYSRSGHTEEFAQSLAAHCGADIENLSCERNYSGLIGYWRAARDAIRAKTPRLSHIQYKPEEYDIVIIGSPNWASHMAPPIRRYIQDNGPKIKQLAVYCTQGGSNGEKVLSAMEDLAGQDVIHKILISQRDFKSNQISKKSEMFISELLNDG